MLDDDGNEVLEDLKQWLPAEVKKVATGNETKKDKAGRSIRVKPGWALLNYDDGATLWTRLKQEDFNCARLGSWRLDLDEVQEAGAGDGTEGEDLEEEEEEEEEKDDEAVEGGEGKRGRQKAVTAK